MCGIQTLRLRIKLVLTKKKKKVALMTLVLAKHTCLHTYRYELTLAWVKHFKINKLLIEINFIQQISVNVLRNEKEEKNKNSFLNL